MSASAPQIEGPCSAVRPVYDCLGQDPGGARSGREIQELSRDAAGTVDWCAASAAPKPATRAAIPAGTYRTFITHADAREHGFRWASVVEEDPDPKALRSKTKEHRLQFTKQGAFVVFRTCGWTARRTSRGGHVPIYRDRITIKGNEGTTISARVEVDGDLLRFTDVQPGPNTRRRSPGDPSRS